jgi:hypothetical protein
MTAYHLRGGPLRSSGFYIDCHPLGFSSKIQISRTPSTDVLPGLGANSGYSPGCKVARVTSGSGLEGRKRAQDQGYSTVGDVLGRWGRFLCCSRARLAMIPSVLALDAPYCGTSLR